MQFEVYLVAKGKDEKPFWLKVNVLLNCAGPEAIEKYSHFVYNEEEEKENYPDVCKKFKELCERRYANIERELLAIVWGAKKFHTYEYGRRVIVGTDHKLLESIFRKPLNDTPSRLQRMLLKLTKYDLDVRYVPGKQQVISDCLTRAPISDTVPATELEYVIGINFIQDLGFKKQHTKKI